MASAVENYKLSRSLRTSNFLFLSSSATIALTILLPKVHCNFNRRDNSLSSTVKHFVLHHNINRIPDPSSDLQHTLSLLSPQPPDLISPSQQQPETATMVRTRRQNPNGAQSPLRSMSNQRVARPQPAPSPPRGAVFPPGMKFFYNENVGLYDDDVSTLDLEGSVRAPSPSGAMAVIRSPSVVSDGMVHIGDDDDGDDESEISEPAVEIRLWDDEEEEDDNPVIIIPDDVRSVSEKTRTRTQKRAPSEPLPLPSPSPPTPTLQTAPSPTPLLLSATSFPTIPSSPPPLLQTTTTQTEPSQFLPLPTVPSPTHPLQTTRTMDQPLTPIRRKTRTRTRR